MPVAAALILFGSPALRAQQPTAQIPPPSEPVPQQTQAPTAAPPEIAADDPDNGEPIMVFGWKTRGHNRIQAGTQAALPAQNQQFALPDFNSTSPGALVSFPGGKFNHIEISYFQADGSGDMVTPIPLGAFGSNYGTGTLMSSTYRVRDVQLTWNYLTYPSPPEDSKFRFRTLYGFNYTNVSATIDAPLDTDPNFTPGQGSRNIYYPIFGVATEYIPSKHFYVEVRTWGFGFPQKAAIGDFEGHAVVRIKHLEIFGGYKWFHFKTSKNTDQYFQGTIDGPTAGLRWIFR